MKAHAYITYNVKKKVVKEKYFYVIMQNSLKKSTKSGKNHGKHITNILTENACNINNPLFNTKKRKSIQNFQSITNSFQISPLHMYF